MKVELKASLDKSLGKALEPTYDAIKGARWWNAWILGTLIMGCVVFRFPAQLWANYQTRLF